MTGSAVMTSPTVAPTAFLSSCSNRAVDGRIHDEAVEQVDVGGELDLHVLHDEVALGDEADEPAAVEDRQRADAAARP